LLPTSHFLSVIAIFHYFFSVFECVNVQYAVAPYLLSLPNPLTDLDEILHAYPHLFKEGFGAGLIPAPSPLRPGGGPETLKAEGHFFYKTKDVQQIAN